MEALSRLGPADRVPNQKAARSLCCSTGCPAMPELLAAGLSGPRVLSHCWL